MGARVRAMLSRLSRWFRININRALGKRTLMTNQESWLAFGAKLLNVCEAILHQAEIPEEGRSTPDPRLVALTLMCRTVNNFAALRLLVENEFIIEARTLVRCCWENLFWIGGLTADGHGFVKRMIGEDVTSKLKRGNELLEWARKVDFEGDLTSFLAKLKAENPKQTKISFQSEAQAGNVGDGYIVYRVLSTDAAHPSATSLSRHYELDESCGASGETLRGTPIIDAGEIEETLEFACSALLGVCVGTNKLVGGTPAGEQLADLFQEFRKLSDASKVARTKGCN